MIARFIRGRRPSASAPVKHHSITFFETPSGDEYETLDLGGKKIISPGRIYMIGTRQDADIRLPFWNKYLGFQMEAHAQIWVDNNGRLKYRDLTDIGSAIVRFVSPLTRAGLQDPAVLPPINSIEHISNGDDTDITGHVVVVIGVHSGTIEKKNIYFVNIKSAADESHCGVRDEYEWGHIRPAFAVME